MALLSMTGFGRGECAAGGIRAEVDVSSVNRKQFDLRVNIPRSLASLEPMVHEAVHKRVTRGSISLGIKLSLAADACAGSVSIDTGLARAYVKGLRKVAAELGLKDDLTARNLVHMPEVIKTDPTGGDQKKAWHVVELAMNAALDRLEAMRRKEGAALGRELAGRFKNLKKLHARIGKLAPGVVRKHRDAMLKRIREAGVEIEPSDQSVLKELAFFADRCDISEELARQSSHFEQAFGLLSAVEPVGRTLDFLCQEMFREINTTGSKANDAGITRLVIKFKTDLEAIREQVQNVE